MKQIKKAASLVLAGAMVFAFAGCGDDTKDKKDMSPEEIIQGAVDKAADLKSLDMTMTMEMNMAVADQTMEMSSVNDVTYFSDPLKVSVLSNTSMGQMGSVSTTLYAQADGDKYTMYLNDGTQWVTQNVALDELLQYDAKASMDVYLDGTTKLTAAGTEDLPGGKADRFDGVVGGEALEKAMASSGALDSLGGDAALTEDLLKDLKDVPVHIWIDQATGYPVRYEMDMTDMMSAMMTKMTESMEGGADVGLTIDKMMITLEYSNFDKATDFEIPAEALDAAK